MSLLTTTVRGLAELYPWEVETSDELVDSLSFIESPHSPETVVRAGYGAGAVVFLLSMVLAVTPLPFYVVAFLGLGFAVSAIQAVHSAPHVLAAFRRTRALGDTPNLVGRAVLRMHIQPATENAVRFAAETGRGPLADSLDAHIDRSIGTPRTGLISFADEWAERFPALRRSAHLLATAQDAPEGERGRTLDRALSAILDGTRDQMADFTASIRGPTTGLYAFGVMLPLALVALIPAVTMAGYSVSIWIFVILYNLILPVGLVAASVWLLVRRPVAFPPPDVTKDHPDVPNRRWQPVALGLAAGAGAYLATSVLGPAYLAPVAGAGLGLGVVLLGVYKPIIEVRNYVRDVEEHLVDALYLVGRQVSENEAVESAIAHAGDRVPAETGEVFEQAAGIQRRLHLSVEEAFLGEHGALRDIPSPRAHGTAALLAIAADEGQPAGRAIVSMADHLEELQEVERETQRKLATVTGTLENTAAFFGPLVGGATVGLAGGMVSDDLAGGGPVDEEAAQGAADAGGDLGLGSGLAGDIGTEAAALPTDSLGVVVGVYILMLCFILTPLSIALRHGLDRSLVGYHVGKTLVSAIPLYVVTVVLVGLVM